MSFLKRLERKLGRWAIPNLTTIIIAGQVLLYILQFLAKGQGEGVDPTTYWLLPSRVLSGEVWRLLTFVLNPPGSNPLFIFFYWFLLYRFGTTLEQQWGTIRFNSYLLIGYVAMVSASLIIWSWGGDAALIMCQILSINLTRGYVDTNMFFYGTLFFAFTRLYPDFVIHAYLVLPIRIVWLATIQWIAYGYVLLRGDWPIRLLVFASVLNYLLFFGREHWRDLKSGQRKRTFQSKVSKAAKQILHQCLVCELNSENSPKTLFRYCSKCDGQCCYCPEHIQGHEHVVAEDSSLAS